MTVKRKKELSFSEQVDQAMLKALASLGDTNSVLELGYFGNLSTEEALVELRAARLLLKEALKKQEHTFVFTIYRCGGGVDFHAGAAGDFKHDIPKHNIEDVLKQFEMRGEILTEGDPYV